MSNTEAYVRQLAAALKSTQERLTQVTAAVEELLKRPRSVQQEIDAIPGRRMAFTLSGEVTFTTSQDGQRGAPVTMLVSQDGPFVMTHYPVISWTPSLPTNATNFGRYSPTRSFPMDTQQVTSNIDVIDIAYELIDAGSQRNFQNLTVSGQIISNAYNMIPCAMPTLFAPNTTVQLVPTYLNIAFAAGAGVVTTQGTLHVDLPGYRIVNL